MAEPLRMESNENDYYKKSYLPSIIKLGKRTGWLGVLMVFAPVLAITFIYGVVPKWDFLAIAITAQLSVNAVWWVIEPVSFYPILGVPGTYIAFLSGNISNLRIPCAAAAQRAVGVKPGTDEATVVSTIGIVASVYVNVVILVVTVVIGSSVLQQMPEAVKSGLNFLLPSLFGAVFAQFAIDDKRTGVIAMVIAIGTLLLYKAGMFSWFPIDPFIANILIPIFGTVIITRFMYSKGLYKED